MARHPDATGEPILFSGSRLTGKPIMSLEETVRAEGGLRLTKPRELSKEEILRLFEKPRDEILAGIARMLLVPENPSRKVYSVLRQIYLTRYDEWNAVLMSSAQHAPKEWSEEVKTTQARKDEAEIWLSPPQKPYLMEDALKMMEGSKSALWAKAVIAGVGKHRRKGQPKSKRHLAVKALDIKVAYPEATLREVTDLLCPCGKQQHTNECRQQLRQQIHMLVKFLKQHGHDFTWEHIK